MIKFLLNSDKEHLQVKLMGDLDIDSTDLFEEELLPLMEDYTVINIMFDEVPFVDSSGMGLLINVVQTLQEKGSEVYIFNVNEEVMGVFELLQLPEILGEEVFKSI
jgi:anti-anti-sigma factor